MALPMLFDDRSLPENRTGTVTKLTDQEISLKFIEFWGCFPKRQGNNPKWKAEQKFTKWVKSGESPETIIAGARRFAAECAANRTDPRFVPMAITWLNQKCWLNDPDHHAGQQDKSFIEIASDLRERAGDHIPGSFE